MALLIYVSIDLFCQSKNIPPKSLNAVIYYIHVAKVECDCSHVGGLLFPGFFFFFFLQIPLQDEEKGAFILLSERKVVSVIYLQGSILSFYPILKVNIRTCLCQLG